MGLSLVLAAVLASSFATNTRVYTRMTELAEAQQGVRAVLSELSQEVRQAGACLPTAGDFIAMDGADEGNHDTLTIRMGRVATDLTCIQPTLTEAAKKGESTLVVDDGRVVRERDWLYIRPSAATGDFYRVSSASETEIGLEGPLTSDLSAGTVVFSIEERKYAIAESNGSPALTVSIDGGEPVDLVPDVYSLEIAYGLDPCPPCAQVDEPADSVEWRLVRSISVTVTVGSPVASHASDPPSATGTTTIHPRNFL